MGGIRFDRLRFEKINPQLVILFTICYDIYTMKNQQNGFVSWIVLAVVGVAIVAGGLFVFRNTQTNQKEIITDTSLPESVDQKSPTENIQQQNVAETKTSPTSNQPPQGVKTNEPQVQKPATVVNPFVLKSEFFKLDSTAQKIASGESVGIDMTTFPLKAIRSYVSTNSFAYRVVSALRMLGYQEGLNSEAYVGQEFLSDFKRINNLPVSSMIDSATLQKIDTQLATRETEDQKLANQFPLYPYFMSAPKNEPTKEHAAAIFQIAFSALPSSLVAWNEANFKAYLRDQGVQFSGLGTSNYKVCLSVLYPEVDDNCSLNTRGVQGFWGSDLAIAGTQIHEYAHFLDGNLYSKESGTSRGVVDTNGFYGISYDMSNTSYPAGSTGKPYPIRRPDNAKNEFVSGYSMGWAVSGKDEDKYIRTAGEDFAESVAMYVVEGKVFRELAKSYPVISQKYDWLKQNVFSGKEYNTGEIRGITFMKANPSSPDVSNGAFNILHFSTYLPDFFWDYRF